MFFNMEEDWVLGTGETPGVGGGGDYGFCQENGIYIRKINKRDTVWCLLLFFTHYFCCGGSGLLWIRKSFLVFFYFPRVRDSFLSFVGTEASCYKTKDSFLSSVGIEASCYKT